MFNIYLEKYKIYFYIFILQDHGYLMFMKMSLGILYNKIICWIFSLKFKYFKLWEIIYLY